MSAVLAFSKLLSDYEGVRRHLLDLLDEVPAEKALRLPKGAHNHVHWNLGHMLYIQCSFFYTRCGLTSPLPRGFRDYFARGSSPATHDSLTPDWDELRAVVRRHSTDLLAKHGDKGALALTRPFTLMNVRVATVGEALSLLLVHEGEHLSRIQILLGTE